VLGVREASAAHEIRFRQRLQNMDIKSPDDKVPAVIVAFLILKTEDSQSIAATLQHLLESRVVVPAAYPTQPKVEPRKDSVDAWLSHSQAAEYLRNFFKYAISSCRTLKT
jgi:hypothetical protein